MNKNIVDSHLILSAKHRI